MSLRGKKLGLLVSAAPDAPNFQHGLKLADAALDAGVTVYLYCIDEAVTGIESGPLQALKARGLNLYACAYGAQRRHIPVNDSAVFAGLTVVSDIVGGTDRFLSFN
jgi:hypothetical protein